MLRCFSVVATHTFLNARQLLFVVLAYSLWRRLVEVAQQAWLDILQGMRDDDTADCGAGRGEDWRRDRA
jgi:hypothetical protein